MGLQERRLIEALKTQTLPERSREIEEICGRAIPYEVDWTSLEHDAQALNFLDNLSCHRLNMALRTICVDEMGREDLRFSGGKNDSVPDKAAGADRLAALKAMLAKPK